MQPINKQPMETPANNFYGVNVNNKQAVEEEFERLRKRHKIVTVIVIISLLVLILLIVGALNWGLIALFSFDLVAWAFGETGFTMLGASGATMGLLMAFGVMHPNNQIFIFPFPMPIKAKWFVIGYIVLELFQGWGVNDGVAHFAHVGGMLWGWALLYYWKNNRKIYF